MAVIVAGVKPGSRASSQTQDWKRTYSLTLNVFSDNKDIGPWEVRGGLPVVIGQRYTEGSFVDYGAFCTSISVREVDVLNDGVKWEAEIQFGPYDANQNPPDPTQWIPKISWTASKFQVLAEKDANDKDIVNSAGVPFNPTVQKDDTRPILQIVKNQFSYNESIAAQYRDTVNQGSFFGYAPGCVKCESITATREFNQDFGYFYSVTYEFAFNKDTWKSRPLDAGLYEVVAGKLVPVRRNGVSVTEPVPLNGSGKALLLNAPAVFLEFDIYKPVDFGAFGLDSFYQYLQTYVNPTPGF